MVSSMVSSLSAGGHPQGLPDAVRKSSGKATRGTACVPSDVQTDVMVHETSPLLQARMSRRHKTLKQTADSMQGLGLGRWLRIVESDESRDRKDNTPDANGVQNQLAITLVSTEHTSDASQDMAGSSRTAVRPGKRRCRSPESHTEPLNAYELERLKRIKANKDMLLSLGLENPLPKPQSCRSRKRSPAVSVNAMAQLSLLTANTHSHPSAADGHGEHGSEIATPRHTGKDTPVAAETDKPSCRADTEATRRNAMGCGGQGSDRRANVLGNDVLSVGGPERLAFTKASGHVPWITQFCTATPRMGCQRSQDASQQKTGDEVGMDAMNSSGSSIMTFVGVLHDDPEETAKTVNLSRPREAEKSKTPTTTRRKRPLSSLYTIDDWVNKTRGLGGEGGGIILGMIDVPR